MTTCGCERLSPHLVKVGRRTECEAMIRHQLFERVPIALARGKKVRCQRLGEMKEGADGPLVRSRLVAMEVAHGIRLDTIAGTAPLKCIRIIISRAASIKNERGRHTRVLALYDMSVAFWHAQLPHDEPIAMYPPRGEEEAGYMWQTQRAMYGTRRASRLFQEHMKGVLGKAGYAALKVCHQVYYCLEADSKAAIHGDDIIAEGEPEKLNRLDDLLKQLVVVKVLDRIGPGAVEHGQYLKRHTSCTSKDRGSSGWKIRNTLLRSPETVPRLVQSRRAPRAARISGEVTRKRQTSWKRWRRSCISKIQASAYTCPVGDSTCSSV